MAAMKKILWIATALLAVAAVSSCNAIKEDIQSSQPRAVLITASVGGYNATKATDNAFEKGDSLGLFVGTPLNVNNMLMVADGSKLVLDGELFWAEGQTAKSVFKGYYPYNAQFRSLSGEAVFPVSYDQSTHAKYTRNDLMAAVTEAGPEDAEVHLTFDHLLSKLLVKIDNRSGEAVKEIFLTGFRPDAIIDCDALKAKGSSGEGYEDRYFYPATLEDASGSQYFSLIVPPQEETHFAVVATLSSGRTEIFYAVADFKPGKQSHGTIVIPEIKIGNQVEFEISISGWEEGGSFRFTDAEVGVRGGYRLSFRNSTNRFVIPMEEKAPGAFYAAIPYYRSGNRFYVLSEYNNYIYGCNLQVPQGIWENNNTWPVDNQGWFELSGYEGPLGVWFYPDRGVLVYEPENLDFEYVDEVEVVQGMFWGEYGVTPAPTKGRLYEEKNNPGLYMLENAFENLPLDNWPYQIIIDARDPQKIFLRPTSNFREPWWWNDYNSREFYVYSSVPEIMEDGEQYGSLNNGVIRLGELTAYYTNSKETAPMNQNDAFQLVLPGATREPVLNFEYSFNGIVEDDGIRFASFTITPSMDVTDVRYMFFQGRPSYQEIEADILPAFRQGAGETVPDLVPGKTSEVRIPIFQNGRYTGFFYASAPGTDFQAYYYNYFTVEIPGSEVPEAGPLTLSDVSVHPAFPESVATMHVDLPYSSVIGVTAISQAAAIESGISEDDYYSLAMNGNYTKSGYMSFVSDTAGGDFSVDSLEPDTEYLIIAAGNDINGNSFWTSAPLKTEKAPSVWEEVGEGTWIDDMWNTGGFTRNVSILKAQGLERYRAVQPYADYWSNTWPSQVQENPDLDGVYIGYSGDFDFTFVEDEGISYIYYLPFRTGYMEKSLNEPDTEKGAWELTHYNLAEKHPGSHMYIRNNKEVSDGAYNIAPYGRIVDTRSYYNWMRMMGGWTLVMPDAAAAASAPASFAPAKRSNYVEAEPGEPVRARSKVLPFKRVPLPMGAPVVKSVNE